MNGWIWTLMQAPTFDIQLQKCYKLLCFVYQDRISSAHENQLKFKNVNRFLSHRDTHSLSTHTQHGVVQVTRI